MKSLRKKWKISHRHEVVSWMSHKYWNYWELSNHEKRRPSLSLSLSLFLSTWPKTRVQPSQKGVLVCVASNHNHVLPSTPFFRTWINCYRVLSSLKVWIFYTMSHGSVFFNQSSHPWWRKNCRKHLVKNWLAIGFFFWKIVCFVGQFFCELESDFFLWQSLYRKENTHEYFSFWHWKWLL